MIAKESGDDRRLVQESRHEEQFDYCRYWEPEEQRLIEEMEDFFLGLRECVFVPLSLLQYHFGDRAGDPDFVYEMAEHVCDEEVTTGFASIELAASEENGLASLRYLLTDAKKSVRHVDKM